MCIRDSYWEEHENSSAAIKAFLVNKVADVGLFVGAIIIGLSAGSFRFSAIMDVIAHGSDHSTLSTSRRQPRSVTISTSS